MRLFIFSAISSLLLIILLWSSCDLITSFIIDQLQSHDIIVSTWELFHGVFALSFGLVPIACWLLWKFGLQNKTRNLVLYIFCSWLFIILCIWIAALVNYVDLNANSPLLPSYDIISTPYLYYWNHVLIFAFATSLGILTLVNLLFRSKARQKINAEQKLIDKK
jgi:uncharacterized membrane protein